MLLHKEIVTYQNELYWIYRKVRAEQVAQAEVIKEYWHCDIALRHGEMIFFCRHIPEAQIVE